MFCPLLLPAVTTTVDHDAAELVNYILPNSTSIALVEGTAKLIGGDGCAGIFTGGKFAVPDNHIDFPDKGIVISTGDPTTLHIQNTDRESDQMNGGNDADLDMIVGGGTMDACSLEFEFHCF